VFCENKRSDLDGKGVYKTKWFFNIFIFVMYDTTKLVDTFFRYDQLHPYFLLFGSGTYTATCKVVSLVTSY
jgi:hypothetical protein